MLPKMHPFMFLFLSVIFIEDTVGQAALTGTFWHITDIHVDQNYSRYGDLKDFCHQSATQSTAPDIGVYGNFLCDSPQSLVNITIESMKEIYPNPDFIMWTGDNLPHVWKPDPEWPVIFEALKNITDLLTSSFPGVAIYPSIGNHDSFPPNKLPGNDSSIYNDYLNKGGWNNIIPNTSFHTFMKGGYYSAQMKPGLRLISLNTILWYLPNVLVDDMDDPADQFMWLDRELENATVTNEKVFIIGHVPPGFYNKVQLPVELLKVTTFHPKFLKQYLKCTSKHSSAIAGQFFGHLHIDTFQLFQYDSGTFHGSALLAPSVTPWYHNGTSLPVNPSVRLMYYNSSNGGLLDYNQYFLNLAEANNISGDAQKAPKYELLYNFKKVYGVPDVSTKSLEKVYEKLKNSSTTFGMFYHLLTAGKDFEACDQHCKTAVLCAIGCTSIEEYFPCMNISQVPTVAPGVITTVAPAPAPRSYTTLYAIMSTLLVVLVLVSLFAFFRIRRKRSNNTGLYQRFPDF